MKTVLVVCHGNINRSPACAVVLKSEFGDAFSVMGAGFVNPGNRAAKKMREAMAERGYDLERHRSQLISQQLVDWAEVVVLMDGGNLKRFTELFPAHVHKVVKLAEHDDPPATRIPDPNYMRKDDPKFDAVVSQIVRCTLRMGVQI